MNRHGSVNRIYRLVWSVVRNVWIPVAEKARGRGKRSGGKLLATVFALGTAVAQGSPFGGQVVAGSGSITHAGVTTTITQASANLSLTWKSFNVAPLESVNFKQPSASSIAVNRIFDTNGTEILGHLTANGQVFLINPNGIVFGPTAQVNVGGLVASTLDLSDSSIDSKIKSFSGSSTASVVNDGAINAALGGYVALLSQHVKNAGVITAKLGTVALGAGRAVTLTFDGPKGVQLQVNESDLNTLAENGGLIRADGGHVVMSAGAKNSLLASVVNNTGVIEARTVESHDGTITLLGGMSDGTVNVGGTLDASAAAGGNGGAVETSAAHVYVADSAKVTTAAGAGLIGSWLIDPTDYTIAASGGDASGAAISSALNTTDVMIVSSGGGTAGAGNVNVNDAVTWSANTTLTLTAANNINVNANIVATGNTAGLILNPRTLNGGDIATANGAFILASGHSVTLSGTASSLFIDGAVYIVIHDLGSQGSASGADLQGMSGNLAGHYALANDIDATITSSWNSGAGFSPISTFNGTFDGLGHTISHLYINRPGLQSVGLIGISSPGSIVQNVGLVAASVTGANDSGALVGRSYSLVSNSYSTGSVHGLNGVGGLLGESYGASSNNYSTASVAGAGAVGGLVGLNGAAMTDSHATGAVTGGGYDVGGLVGLNNVSIARSYATGNVTNSGAETGGLAGYGGNGSITASYATGNVSSYGIAGGLISTIGDGTVTDSYATGSVTGSEIVGGLVGRSNYGQITRSYATGAVTGGLVGGLVGINEDGGLTGDFWNASVNAVGIGAGMAGGATGVTTAAMMTMANFSGAGWDIASVGGSSAIWRIYPGSTTPLLRSFLTPLTITADNVSQVYGGAAPSALANVSYSVAGAAASGHLFGLGDPYAGVANVGGSAPTVYSDQAGYDISYVNAALTVTPATLTVLATSASKIYGQANPAFSGSVSGFAGSDTLANATSGTEVFTSTATGSSNVGSYAVTGSGLVANNGNYIFSADAANATALTITPASLTVTGELANNKVYDGGITATLSGGVLAGVLFDDAVSLNQSGHFASKNVGSAVSVTVTDTLSGVDAGNYIVTQPTGLNAAIVPATLTMTANSASRSYGQANPEFSGSVTGFVGSDTLANATTGSAFTSAAVPATNVGSYAITTAGLSANNGNYVFVEASGNASALTITRAALTVQGESAANKVYDGTTAATLKGGTLVGLLTGDAVNLTQAGAFTSKNAATAIAITTTDTLSGAGAGNYTLTQPAGLVANIEPLALTVLGEHVTNKVYDGTSVALLTGASLSGVLEGDSVTLTQSGAFAAKDVGTAIAVTSTDSLSGVSAGNYSVIQPSGLNANITPATLTYDAAAARFNTGQTLSPLSGTLTGFVADDTEANSTTGTLAWTTTAQTTSPAGLYSISGGGLAAENYVFVEAADDATALALAAGPPQMSLRTSQIAVTSIEASLPASNTSVHLAMLDTAFVHAERDNPASSVTPDSANSNPAAAESRSAVSDWTTSRPTQAPLLRIEQGGIKLPDYEVTIDAR